MKEIPLSQGDGIRPNKNSGKYFMQVDDSDYEPLSKFKWRVEIDSHTMYSTRAALVGGKRLTIRSHRLIMNVTDPKIKVDHIDGNGLNNQKSNLRVATHSQNMMNRKKANKKKYKGTIFHKAYGRWSARLGCNGICKHLGSFATEIEAAKAYDDAARFVYGEFARLNFPSAPVSPESPNKTDK